MNYPLFFSFSSLAEGEWPYVPSLLRIALALGIGMFVGLERERRGKEAGTRTFAFVSLLGCLGALIGTAYAISSLFLLGILVIFENIQALKSNQGAELTTSAALLVTGFAGILCGLGHTLMPVAIAVITTSLLYWKRPLAGFSHVLTEEELRSAILLAILTFVIYPALPQGSIDPWNLLDLRIAWITVILIAAIGFANYILLKLYGARGIELSGFLGGFINSTITVSELSKGVQQTKGRLAGAAYVGILFATGAMVLRNGILLLFLAPSVLQFTLVPILLMILTTSVFAFLHRKEAEINNANANSPQLEIPSPFSLGMALKFGLVFVVLQIAGTLAQRNLGYIGVYAISFLGGLFSSSSSVAATATLSAQKTISPGVAGMYMVISSLASVLINMPLVLRSANKLLINRLRFAFSVIILSGIIGALIQAEIVPLFHR